jgi:hypothetical protein
MARKEWLKVTARKAVTGRVYTRHLRNFPNVLGLLSLSVKGRLPATFPSAKRLAEFKYYVTVG